MKPKPQPADAFQLFQAHFRQILNRAHPLVQLADQIDWPRFDAAFADSYSEALGAPGKAIRLMVGLQYLKYAFNESDESVVDRWVENPYWQYFCGFTHMQHEAPLDPSSLSRWCKRVGAERLAQLLTETVEQAVRTKQTPKRDLKQVTVDTTVQEKNITHPPIRSCSTLRSASSVNPPRSAASSCGNLTFAWVSGLPSRRVVTLTSTSPAKPPLGISA